KDHVASLSNVEEFRTYSAFWRLTIDAGADSGRHSLGLAAHPRWNDRAEPAGRTAGRDHEQMVRRVERGMNFVGPVAHDRALADVSPFAAANTGALVDEFRNVTLGPARRLYDVAQLLRDHDGIVAAVDRIMTLVGAHLGGERLENFPRVGGPLIHD